MEAFIQFLIGAFILYILGYMFFPFVVFSLELIITILNLIRVVVIAISTILYPSRNKYIQGELDE